MQLFRWGSLGSTYYKGMKERAAHGLHQDVFDFVKPFLKINQCVLDFGCGEGAFAQRLTDAGVMVDACDLDIEQIKAEVKTKIKIDLNKSSFSDNFQRKYEMVFAIEIIEHLENPWKTVRDAISALDDGGYLILSTPNVSSFISRLRFFMKGTLLAFEKPDLAHGHITPMPHFQLEYIFQCLNLKIVKKGFGGPVPLFHFVELSRYSILRNSILPILYPFMSGPKQGRALVYVLQKAHA
jgi:2-polyprenyl-3-methyl-5-hydroxy-6-metoxy-1,4-benzoquinol methylase